MHTAFLNLGTTELLIVLGVILFLFGGTKLPQLARGIGESIKHLRNAAKDDDDHKT